MCVCLRMAPLPALSVLFGAGFFFSGKGRREKGERKREKGERKREKGERKREKGCFVLENVYINIKIYVKRRQNSKEL